MPVILREEDLTFGWYAPFAKQIPYTVGKIYNRAGCGIRVRALLPSI